MYVILEVKDDNETRIYAFPAPEPLQKRTNDKDTLYYTL